MIRPGSLPGDAAGQAMAPPADTTPQVAGSPPVTSENGRGLAVDGILVGAVTLLLSMIGIMMKLSAA